MKEKQEVAKRGIFRKLIWVAGGLMVLLAGGFFLASLWVNSIRISFELRQPPARLAELAGIPSDQVEKTTIPASRYYRPAATDPRQRPGAPPTEGSYQDYLLQQLKEEPGLSAARIYLEILKQREQLIAGYLKNFISMARQDSGEIPGPITPAQAAWLRSQGDLLEKIHQLSRAGALPCPTIGEMTAKVAAMQPAPTSDAAMLATCQSMLGRDAMLSLQQHDYVGARRSIVDGWKICGLHDKADCLPPVFWASGSEAVNWALLEWLDDTGAPPKETKALVLELKQIEEEFLKEERLAKAVAAYYLLDRTRFVWMVEHTPWNSDSFGWFPGSSSNYFPIYLSGNRTVALPRLDSLAVDAYRAMRRKNSFPQLLPLSDRLAAESFGAITHPYPEFIKEQAALEARPEYHDLLFSDCSLFAHLFSLTNYSSFHKQMFLKYKTQLHLIRTGLAWRLDPAKTLALRDHDPAISPYNPWRDPFTEHPLQVDTASSPTLFWSHGPDLQDQKGLITYDPTNGMTSAGDIVIRVPR